MKMPFGKYSSKNFPPNGVDIAFINSGYLKWLVATDDIVKKYDALIHEVEQELKYRDDNGCHFYEDKVI
jgi:hypothetical protein